MAQTSLLPLLEDMDNWDKDKRFMAASDLTQHINTSNRALDTNQQQRICTAFLKQLEDQSVDVQGNAVKCLAKIMGKFQEQQIGEVIKKLSELILTGKPEVRDIYATCLKGLLQELPANCSTLACSNVLSFMLKGISSVPSPEVKEECADVLHDLLKRFGDNKVWWCDQESMTNALLNLLSQKPSLRKKASACIGVLAAVVSDRHLDSLVQVLLRDVRTAQGQVERQTYIQCIGIVGRSVGGRIGGHLSDIAPLFLQICKQATDSGENASDGEHEVVENCLNAFESFASRCPTEINPFMDDLLALLLKLIAYDPNFYADDDANMDEEFDAEFDDDMVESDDDDTSWKVRRAALRVVAALIKHVPEKMQRLFSTFATPLIDRFREREENVKLDVFLAFQDMVQVSVLPRESLRARDGTSEDARGNTIRCERPVISSFYEQIPVCIEALTKHMRANAPKQRQGALSLLRCLASKLPHRVAPSMVRLQHELLRSLADSTSSIRYDGLCIVTDLARDFTDPAPFQQLAPELYPALIKCTMDSYYKVAAQGLRACGWYVHTLRSALSANAGHLTSVMEVLQRTLVATDIDQEVKEASLECFGHMLAVCGNQPFVLDALAHSMNAFVERMRNEVTRTTAMKALKRIAAAEIEPRVPLEPVLDQICVELCRFLDLSSRSIRQQVLDCTVPLLQRYGDGVPFETSCTFLAQVEKFVSDMDLYITDLCIQVIEALVRRSGVAAQIAELCLPRILTVCRSPLLQGAALESILRLLSNLFQFPEHFPFDALFDQLTDLSMLQDQQAQASRHVVATLSKALAQLVLRADPSTKQRTFSIFGQCLSSPADTGDAQVALRCELYLLTIGEIGKHEDLSAVAGVTDLMLQHLSSSRDEIAQAAAVGFGCMTAGAMSSFLAVLIQRMQTSADSPKIRYLLLTSLREVIAVNASRDAASLSQHISEHLDGIFTLLIQNATREEESVRAVVSECFGHLLAIVPEATAPQLHPLFRGASAEARATAVASLRCAAPRSCPVETMLPFADALVEALSDTDLQVRKAGLQAVNVVCQSSCNAVLRPVAGVVLERLWEESQVNHKLIREVDLGPFKHKVDDGLPLRKIAYQGASSLLAAYGEAVPVNRMMDFVKQGLTDQEDVQVGCCQLLSDLCVWARPAVVARLGDIIEPFERVITQSAKQAQNKQQASRVADNLRLFARTLKNVEAVAEGDGRQPFLDFVSRLNKDQAFAQAYDRVGSRDV
mmetsp:Transcript_51394/g.135553  ORF Transcript_51394/g.135553 Transcript_51394/m.135553 type:complete len:1241 (+) Transcript_51394:52-3774(+)